MFDFLKHMLLARLQDNHIPTESGQLSSITFFGLTAAFSYLAGLVFMALALYQWLDRLIIGPTETLVVTGLVLFAAAIIAYAIGRFFLNRSFRRNREKHLRQASDIEGIVAAFARGWHKGSQAGQAKPSSTAPQPRKNSRTTQSSRPDYPDYPHGDAA